MSWISEVVNHVAAQEHNEAQKVINRLPAGVIRNAAQGFANSLAKLDPSQVISGLGGRKTMPHPRGPAHGAAGVPIYGGSTFSPKGPPRPADTEYRCCYNADGSPCEGRRPFPFLMKVKIAAGAHAAGAQLGQFVLPSDGAGNGCKQITQNMKFPNNAITEIVKVTISTGLDSTAAEAVLATLYIRELHAEAEVARYPLLDLFPLISKQSAGDGSGAATSQQKYDNAGVAFPQSWDPNTEYELQLYSSVDIDPAEDIEITLGASGTIKN